MEITEILGQGFSILAMVLAFISYQMPTQKRLLVVQTAVAAVIALSYCLLGAYPGMVLNILAVVRNLIYYNKRIFSAKFWPYLLCALMLAGGIFTWDGPMTLLVIVGLVINTFFLSLPNAQTLRKSILFTSLCVLAYNIYVLSVGGILMEVVSWLSALLGVIRYRKANKAE